MKRICVVGSINIDIITSTERFPTIGENVFADTFEVFQIGGKGANQALALGRLGQDVSMVGLLGDKFYSDETYKLLGENNVDCRGISLIKDQYPGIGLVIVDKNGDNEILVYPGTNNMMTTAYIDQFWDIISNSDIILFQLEIPVEVSLYAMKRLKSFNKTIILDPAPVKKVPDEIYQYVDYLTPNETELQGHTQMAIVSDEDMKRAAGHFIDKGVGCVIHKAGRNGAYIIGKDIFHHVQGYQVNAIDSTAAGDAFNAGLAYGLAQESELLQCVNFANAVGALTTTAIGAENSIPYLKDVFKILDVKKITK